MPILRIKTSASRSIAVSISAAVSSAGQLAAIYQVSNWFGVENDISGPMLAAARSILLRSTRPRRARPRRTGLTRRADASASCGTGPCSTAPAAPPSQTRRLGRRRHRICGVGSRDAKARIPPLRRAAMARSTFGVVKTGGMRGGEYAPPAWLLDSAL
jgi:hypothetical protein